MSDISIDVRTMVQGGDRDSAWTAYEASFAPLRVRAMQRACMTRDEFDDCMADERITKYVAADDAGTVHGIGTMTNRIEAMPLVSPEYFEHRWPADYGAGRCYYIGIVAAAPDRQGTELFTKLIHLMAYRVGITGGVCVLDICQANVDDHDFPRSIRRICGQVLDDIDMQQVDTQTYWAYSVPAQRNGDRVIDLRNLSQDAMVALHGSAAADVDLPVVSRRS